MHLHILYQYKSNFCYILLIRVRKKSEIIHFSYNGFIIITQKGIRLKILGQINHLQ